MQDSNWGPLDCQSCILSLDYCKNITKIILRLKKVEFKNYIIKKYCFHLFLCFQPFYRTTLKKRKNHKKENCTKQDSNWGPLDCQSCILSLDYCKNITKIILRLKKVEFKSYIIKKYCFHLFLCFQPFYRTTLKKRKNHKKENCAKQDSNWGPLDCQSCILSLDYCTGLGITV